MPNRILLTGAGVSKNWGGYLARELWERLLAHPEVRAAGDLRRALLDTPEDFETALETIRSTGPERARAIEDALHEVFVEQDKSENGNQFESSAFNGEHLALFPDRFRRHDGTSVLFTLNQDAFLERR